MSERVVVCRQWEYDNNNEAPLRPHCLRLQSGCSSFTSRSLRHALLVVLYNTSSSYSSWFLPTSACLLLLTAQQRFGSTRSSCFSWSFSQIRGAYLDRRSPDNVLGQWSVLYHRSRAAHKINNFQGWMPCLGCFEYRSFVSLKITQSSQREPVGSLPLNSQSQPLLPPPIGTIVLTIHYSSIDLMKQCIPNVMQWYLYFLRTAPMTSSTHSSTCLQHILVPRKS